MGTRFSEPLPSKWIFASVRCYLCFQTVFTEPLPSNSNICHSIMITEHGDKIAKNRALDEEIYNYYQLLGYRIEISHSSTNLRK
jgi:hypothetical protein